MANTTTTPKEEIRTGLEKTKNAAAQAVDKTKEAATTVGEMVTNTATAVGKKADELTSKAGASLSKVGETISQQAPREGMLGSASQAVASTIKDSGRYIEEAGLSGMADDLTDVIRRNPVPAVLIGIGLGFCIGRALRS